MSSDTPDERPSTDPRGPEYDVCPRCGKQGQGQNVRCVDADCGWVEGDVP